MVDSPAHYPTNPAPAAGRILPTSSPSENDAFHLALLEAFFPSWAVLLCDRKYHRIRLASRTSLSVLGYSAESLRLRPLNDLLHYAHPEDREAVHRTGRKIEEWIKALNEEELPQYRYMVNFRWQRPDRTYIHLRWEQVMLPRAEERNDYFVLLHDITHEKPFARVQLEIYQVVQQEYRRINSYVPLAVDSAFTQRELEVLQLIKQGLSSKEIAHQMNISLNTVRNHRSNLFKKTQVKNMIELLNYDSPALN